MSPQTAVNPIQCDATEVPIPADESTGKAVDIRRMRADDLPQVQLIDQLSFSLPWPAKAYRFELEENPNSMQWVAVKADKDRPDGTGRQKQEQVVGVIVIWLIIDEAHIATLAVHPEARGQGIAGKLLAVALENAFQRGAVTATLEVRASNQIAQHLYHQFHFEITGSRPHYYKDNDEDAVIMTAELSRYKKLGE